jgi:hypothetical protein
MLQNTDDMKLMILKLPKPRNDHKGLASQVGVQSQCAFWDFRKVLPK